MPDDFRPAHFRPADSKPLRSITRIFWGLITLALGVVPSFLFFVWIERNMALPRPGRDLVGELFLGGHPIIWPWVVLWDFPASVRALWDFGLFLGFGYFHTLLAQRTVQAMFRRVLPAQCIRALYLCFTGISAILVMGLWQSSGVIVWRIPGLSFQMLSILSLVIFWLLMAGALRTVMFFDPLEFLGFRQLYSSPSEIDSMSGGGQLLEKGFYSRVRHPIYFFTLAAIALAPMMSLDRLIFLAAVVAYLVVAIPIEERKLESRFGEAYRAYRQRVPAVIPKL